jgi:uncharacterized protein DUF5946
MSEDRCPECGAHVNRGLDGCLGIWDEVSMLAYEHPMYAQCRDLAFDTYCMQHPEQYGRSAKAYAAHLTRLCCGVERNADPAIYAAIRQWLDGKVDIEKPQLLRNRGDLTVMNLRVARNAEEHAGLVSEWAQSVWMAYMEQQALARHWLDAALAAHARERVKQH